MKVLVLGGDGYLGWPTAMHFASRGAEVRVVDNYLRRKIALETDSEPLIRTPTLQSRCEIYREASGRCIEVSIGDCCDFSFLRGVVDEFHPDVLIHYAEQPSAPYSMSSVQAARVTLENNIGSTFNVIWSVIQAAPTCHIIKLGTMGEYGTPDIDIEEGWLTIEHKGRSDRFLFPRQAGSLYHTTKILDTDLLWFYVRAHGIQVTDLMQGPVYGIRTDEADSNERLMPNFHYDDIFGTVVNRFIVQAVAGIPLTVYGKGGQTRGYLNLKDTLQCVELAAASPPGRGKLRVLNQFTEQFSVTQLAERIRNVAHADGIDVRIQRIPNPRKEAEEHYYNATHSGLVELGLEPHLLTDDVISDMLATVSRHKGNISPSRILPRVRWNS